MALLARLCVLFLVIVSSIASTTLPSFDSFVQLYRRSYEHGSAEYVERRALYEKNKHIAELQNSRSDRLWSAGVNELWDWTDSEFQGLRGWDGSRKPQSGSTRAIRRHETFLQRANELPKEKIWSKLTMSKRVKNQGACGSCWAIAAATVLEAHQEIYSGKFRTFSAQQIVSCTPNPRQCGGSGGCEGATAELAMDWVLHHGCAEESAVPYSAEDESCTAAPVNASLQKAQIFSESGHSARRLSGAAAFGMTGWETLPKNKYEPLVRAIVERGPVAVSVAANTWQAYESGIFDSCGKDAVIDHAVTATGYGEDQGIKFWLIQNSWGADWGESGHIRLLRHDSDDYCGMNNDPEQGVACKGENTPVPVCGMCGVLFDSVVPHFKPPQLSK